MLIEYFNINYGQTPGNIPVIIQVYDDDVETKNPLESKVGIHKIGAFYFVIKNFPPPVNSSLHNIHLLALTHAADLKRYGFAPVLETPVKELIKLEKQGFELIMNENQGCADNRNSVRFRLFNNRTVRNFENRNFSYPKFVHGHLKISN
jgi:hypothetical protein